MLCPLVSPEANADMLRTMKPVSVFVLVPVRVPVGVVWSCRCPASVVLSVEFGVGWEVWVD